MLERMLFAILGCALLCLLLEQQSVVGFSPTSLTVLLPASKEAGSGSSGRQKRSSHLSNAFFSPDQDDDDNDDENDDDNDEYLKKLSAKYLKGKQPADFLRTLEESRPSKSDIYDEEELSNLLQLHQQIAPQTANKKGDDDGNNNLGDVGKLMDGILPPSLHDMVLETIQEIDNSASNGNASPLKEEAVATLPSYSWLTEDLQKRASKITAIASDVDGTLTTSTQTIHPRTQDAIRRAISCVFSPIEKLQWFFPATGKTRQGAYNSLGPELAALVSQCPGVYIQGLYCMIGDNVVFEKKLSPKAIEACEKLVADSQTSIIAYDGDNLYTNDLDEVVKELSTKYGEPMAIEIPSITNHENGVHKILVCDHDLEKLASVRVQLEALAKETGSCVTQAVPTMLELLPEGCSKALGVQKLCEALGIDPGSDLLAIGDAENDVEMLQLASIGVVVGNAGDLAKNAADVVLEETNDEGGAGVAMEILGGV